MASAPALPSVLRFWRLSWITFRDVSTVVNGNLGELGGGYEESLFPASSSLLPLMVAQTFSDKFTRDKIPVAKVNLFKTLQFFIP